jgi:two-component system NarL family sensor kinase
VPPGGALTGIESVTWRFRIWRSALGSKDPEAACREVERVLEQAFGAERVILRLDSEGESGGSIVLRANGKVLASVRVRRSAPLSSREERALRLLCREAVAVLRALSEIRRAEGHRLATHLHQGPAQHLANALLNLRMGREILVEDPEAARKLLDLGIGLVQQAMDAVRGAIRALRSGEEVPVGLEEAVRRTWAHLQPLTSADLEIHLEPPGPLPPHVERALTAVACEAVTNAAKHAGADRIEVYLRRLRGAIELEVSDNGRGVGRVRRGVRSFGLDLMREHVERLGGRFEIQRGVPTGTRVVAHVPLLIRPAPEALPVRARGKPLRSRRRHAHSGSAG